MKNDKGFVTKILLIVVALISIKYAFNFDIVEWFQSPTVQKYLSYVLTTTKSFYNWLDTLVRGWLN